MSAPTSRLLWWCAWLGLPLGLVGGLAPGLALPCLALFLLAAVIVIGDLARGLRAAPAFTVQLPVISRYSLQRPGAFVASLVKESETPHTQLIRVGLAFPAALRIALPIQTVHVPGAVGTYPISWECLPAQRGQHYITGVYVEELSALGFWALRRQYDQRAELRIYPNLLAERNRMASLFLNREGAGMHAQRLVGKGREFEQLREYIPGDSYEDIHWKATARRGHPITKTYQVERTQEVYVVVDASRLSARPIPGRTAGAEPEAQLELLLRAALLLGVVAEKQGDFFGLVAFSDQVHSFIRASKGRGHFNRCREALYTLQPRIVNPDFEDVCTFIRMRLRRRALVVFLTNLDDPVLAESLSRNLELLSNRHLVLVNMITPGHVRPLFSKGEVQSADEIYARLGGHLQWQSLRETQRSLHRHGVDMHLAGHESLCGDMVAQYVSVKQRQLL